MLDVPKCGTEGAAVLRVVGTDADAATAATAADPGTAGAYSNEVDAVVLLDARNSSAAAMVAAQLPGVFSGQLQVRHAEPVWGVSVTGPHGRL